MLFLVGFVVSSGCNDKVLFDAVIAAVTQCLLYTVAECFLLFHSVISRAAFTAWLTFVMIKRDNTGVYKQNEIYVYKSNMHCNIKMCITFEDKFFGKCCVIPNTIR